MINYTYSIYNIWRPWFMYICIIYLFWKKKMKFCLYFPGHISCSQQPALISIPRRPAPRRYSEAQWSWVHPRWHLPAAVHDCGEIGLNLQGTALNGEAFIDQLPDTVTDRANQPIAALETDRRLIYRWDEAGWGWLTDGLSPSHWGITKPSRPQQDSNIMSVHSVC